MRLVPCHACNGARLKPASLAVTVNDRNISEVCELAIGESAPSSSPRSSCPSATG